MWAVPHILIQSLMPRCPGLDQVTYADVSAAVVDHVRRSLDMAPAHIRIGLRLLVPALAAWIWLVIAVSYPWLDRCAAAERALVLFEALPQLGPNLLRLYRSLVVLAFYDHPNVARAAGWENARERQARYREQRERVLETKT